LHECQQAALAANEMFWPDTVFLEKADEEEEKRWRRVTTKRQRCAWEDT